MSHNPRRLCHILIDILSQLELLNNDPVFENLGPDAKLAKLTKVFLSSIGAVGIKIAQFLSTSTLFGLPGEFIEELGELRSNAAPVNIGAVLSVLNKVGKGDVEIERVLGNASIKVVVKIKGKDRVLKVKKLNCYRVRRLFRFSLLDCFFGKNK